MTFSRKTIAAPVNNDTTGADTKVITGTQDGAKRYLDVKAKSITGNVQISSPTGPYLISEETVTSSTGVIIPTGGALLDRVTVTITNESADEADIIYVVNNVGDTISNPKIPIRAGATWNIAINDDYEVKILSNNGTGILVTIFELASTPTP